MRENYSMEILEEFKHDFDEAGLKNINDDDDCQVYFVFEIRIFENRVFSESENNDPNNESKYHKSEWLS